MCCHRRAREESVYETGIRGPDGVGRTDGDDGVKRYVLLPSAMLRLFSNKVSSRGGVFIGDWECLGKEPWTIDPPSSIALERVELATPLIGIGRGDDDTSVDGGTRFLA